MFAMWINGKKRGKKSRQAVCNKNGEGRWRHASVLTFKARLARTPVPVHQIVASASILAWVRKTFISVHFTVDANPACITEAFVSERQNYFRRGMNARLGQR